MNSRVSLKPVSWKAERDFAENPLFIESGAGGEMQQETDPNFPVVLDHNDPIASESFSILRSRLLSVHKKLGTKSFVITSAEPGDGKTLVAANVSMSFRQLSSYRVLLVDGDLRTGNATRILKLRHLPGVSDFLQGKKPFQSVIHTTAFPSVSVAPAGVVPTDALPGILAGSRWPEFLQECSRKFDLIVVDSVPVSAPIADLELLVEPCEAILMVVHMRQTHRDALKRATARLDTKKFLGVIINNSNQVDRHHYRYYGEGFGNTK